MADLAPDRIAALEQRLIRTQLTLLTVCLAGSALMMGAVVAVRVDKAGADPKPREIRTNRLVVEDENGTPRVIIGEDPKDPQRRSRAAGITIHDKTGTERGGLSTMEDGSVVFALDAPTGVGAPMRDRAGMVVYPDGSSYFMLIDNETRGVVKLFSDGKGGGGPQVFKWDDQKKKVNVKTLTFDGPQVAEFDTGK